MTRVRFPNESYYDTIDNFDWDEFKPYKMYGECVFGWYQDVYVCVSKEDYEEYTNRGNDNK
jgi:hypothetical protein